MGGQLTSAKYRNVPLIDARKVANKFIKFLGNNSHFRLEITGSIRRMMPLVNDVEIVIMPTQRLYEIFPEISPNRRLIKYIYEGHQVDIFVCKYVDEWGAMVLHTTGPPEWNIRCRRVAQHRGYKLNQYGLWNDKEDRVIAGNYSERELLDKLGITWREPQDRIA